MKGSRVLAEWNAQRQAIRNSIGDQAPGALTLKEASALFDITPPRKQQTVNERVAMRVAAVYACVGLISGAIASMPLPIFKRPEVEPSDHPYWWILNEQPNANWSAAAFWEYITSSMLLYGDGFAEIMRPSFVSPTVIGLRPLHPQRVEPFEDQQTGEIFYRVTATNGKQYVRNAADILHFPTLGFDGIRSPSPIRLAARSAIGIALSGDEYSESFFTDLRPDLAVLTPRRMDETQVNQFRQQWSERYIGSDTKAPIVLHGDQKIEKLSISSQDAELLSTRGFQIEEIARIFGVPAYMIGHSANTTQWGTGMEAQGKLLVKFTLRRHLTKIEQEINRKFWPTRERYFVRFDTADIERGDFKTRNEGYRVALGRAGEPAWMTINEVRRKEGLKPVDGGDDLPKPDQGPTNEPPHQAPDQQQ